MKYVYACAKYVGETPFNERVESYICFTMHMLLKTHGRLYFIIMYKCWSLNGRQVKKIMKSMGRILQTHFGCGLVNPKALSGCTCRFYDVKHLEVLTTALFYTAPLKVNCRKNL